MRTLALLPDWVEHARRFPGYSDELLRKGHTLGVALDKAILSAYTNGRRPNWLEQIRVHYAAKALRDVYKTMQDDELLRELVKDIHESDD